ncbi:MAG: pyrimidine 5'-nucleotidase [Anaerolineales bacterium]|nr:pyrimidine 5'-nucleotidase [Anaerolineales bacterium]
MPFTTLLCDLDDTLYPPASGLWGEIAGRINQYMHERLGFPREQIATLRESLFRQYGTTLRGLQATCRVDADEYLAFVHDVPLERYLHPDPVLRTVLESLDMRRYIFTNADAAHAGRVLQVLGLEGVFTGILDIHTMSPYCKPMPEAFDLALRAIGDPDPRLCILVDDQPRSLGTARTLGMTTILVSLDGPSPDCDPTIRSLAELPGVLAGV